MYIYIYIIYIYIYIYLFIYLYLYIDTYIVAPRCPPVPLPLQWYLLIWSSPLPVPRGMDWALSLELACGTVGWLEAGLLPMFVHVIIPPPLLWIGWGFRASEFSSLPPDPSVRGTAFRTGVEGFKRVYFGGYH